MTKGVYCFLALLFCILFFPIAAYANSAEPPALVIIVKNAPADISIISAENMQEGQKRKVAWETYYAFYNRDIGNRSEINLVVSGNGTSYRQTIGKAYLKGYNSVITLDFIHQTIAAGKLVSRSIILVSLRVFFTLIIEGIVFFMFGFRNKKSWLAFIIINLLTQGILNIVLNDLSPYISYKIFLLIFIEFFVFVAESVGFLVFVKEHGRLRRIFYVLSANLASLFLGGYLITVLPV